MILQFEVAILKHACNYIFKSIKKLVKTCKKIGIALMRVAAIWGNFAKVRWEKLERKYQEEKRTSERRKSRKEKMKKKAK